MKLELFLLICAVGCRSAASIAPSAAPSASPSATAAGHATAGLPRYAMDIALIPERHELRVTGTLVVAAPSGPITLALMDAMTGVELTSSPAGTWSAPSAPQPGAGNTERTLTLAAPAREVTIRFSYASTTESKFVYHVGTDAMFAGGPTSAWYPQTSGKAIGTLAFHVPERYRVVAGGAASDRVAGGVRTTTVEYALPSTFSFAAAPWRVHARDGVVAMRAYVLRDRPEIAAYLDGCSRALAVLSREFGAYPYREFALIELPSEATQPAGFSGASFEGFMAASSKNLDDPFNLAYFGHEIGHQWWGNVITKAGRDGGMLTDEGLAQYGSLRVVEELAGADAAERYRRRGYPGYSDAQSGLGYLRSAAAGIDEPVAAARDGYSPVAHQLANSKGLLALEQLARDVGRARFRDALHEVTRRFAFRAMAWHEFRAIVQSHADHDVGAVFAQWFDRTGAPDLAVEWTPSGRAARGAVVQRGAPYRLELDVALIGARDSAIRRLAISGERTPFAFDAPFEIQRIELDPRFEVLHWTPEYRAEAEALVDYTRAMAKVLAGDADAAEQLFAAGLARTPLDEPHGARFLLEYGYGSLLLRLRGDRAGARTHLTAALAAPVRAAEYVPWAHVKLAQIASAEHDAAATARHARAAIDAEAATGATLGAAAAVAPLLSPGYAPLQRKSPTGTR